MKRRSSSYILLLVFLSLVIHDMIPHHEEFVFESDGYDHILTHCNTESTLQNATEACNFHSEEEAGHHESCPPHFHKCTVTEFDLNRGNRQLSSNPDASSDVFTVNSDISSMPIFEKGGRKSFLLADPPYNSRYQLGAISLRAPPAIS